MPRQPNGSYNLPLPSVVSGDIVEAAWANTSLNDIAATLQDSLSRTGQGGMSQSILLVDGTKAAPGFGFVNESGTGAHRPSAGNLYFSVLGQDYLRLSEANGVQFTLDGTTWVDITGPVWDSEPIEFVDGTELLPSITFASETSTGIYWAGAGDLRITASGVDQFRVTDSGAQFSSDGGSTWNAPTVALWETAPMPFINGTVTEPSITFANDTDTGFYLAAAGDLRTVVGGASIVRTDSTGPQVQRGGQWKPLAAYDEGVWTPQVDGFSMLSQTYGFWSRVGNQVTIFADVRWNVRTTGSLSDPVVISGLPFEIRVTPNAGSARMYVPTFMGWSDINISGRSTYGGPEVFSRTLIKDPGGTPKAVRFAVYVGNNAVEPNPITTSGGQAIAYETIDNAVPSAFADTVVYPTLEELISSGALSFTMTYLTDDTF